MVFRKFTILFNCFRSLKSDSLESGDHKGLRKRPSVERQSSVLSEKVENQNKQIDDGVKLIDTEQAETGSVRNSCIYFKI